MNLRDYEKLFKALSDKQRLRILAFLTRGPLVVNDIKTILHLSMSTVSQHLSILREVDLVIDNKQGRWVIYSIHPDLEKKQDIAGVIFRDIKERFKDDQAVEMDLQILETIARPAVTLREELHLR